MDLKITGGKIVTSQRTFQGEIGITRGKITALGSRLSGQYRKTIDADGMLVFPGVVDVHVHFQLQTGDISTVEDFADGTRAAAAGGVTTVIDFAIQEKGNMLSEAIRQRRALADGHVAIDYALHAAPTDWNERTRAEIHKLSAQGISSFKLYMIYAKAGLASDDGALYSALAETARHGGLVTVHAESAALLDLFINRYHNKKDMARYGAYCQALSRPNIVEAEAINRAIFLAERTGGRLYIVHLSTKDGVDLVRDARRRGVKVYAETCPQYLLLDDSVFRRPDGHLFAACPQIKGKGDADALWAGLADGTISVVATDNCTFSRKQKDRWREDFTKIPYGIPGVETLLPLFYTNAVSCKGMSLRKMIRLLGANPARLMGLYPRKGEIAIGSDADLVIFDPDKAVTLKASNLQTKCDWSAYENFNVKGYPVLTISRGKIIAENGRYTGLADNGQFIRRDPGRDL